jgi:hypothetical protein
LFLDGGNRKAAGSESKTIPTLLGRLKSAASTTIDEFASVSSGGKTKRLALEFVSNTDTPNRTAVLFLRQGYKPFQREQA